ncbi:MAG: Xaa-Pro peptidase family protein [Calditrichota bacterium]
MAIGVGGSTAKAELEKLSDMTSGVQPIQTEEFEMRLDKARKRIEEQGLAAIYLHAGTNLYYFTGMKWKASERMVGALVTAKSLDYIAPAFEHGTVMGFMKISGELHCWEEHESPYELFGKMLSSRGISGGEIGMDESAPFFITDGLRLANPQYNWVSGTEVTAGCRMYKSNNEIAIIQRAKDMTMAVQRAAARIMRPGISEKELVEFIHEAHKKVGAPAGSYFCIILFGEDTQYPHGVPAPRDMRDGDVVLVDTGCQLHGYISDITRTYVYGDITPRQREIWNLEKAVQQAAFDAAQLGSPCSAVDDAARAVLTEAGLGPDYKLPGLSHRTGHGTGLDIHEYPYAVRGNDLPLQQGMVFSNEPMICVPGEFGIRLEDHIYMTEDGPQWFTQPMKSIDDPFGD